MMKQIMLLLKNKMRLISLCFIISFLSENCSWMSQTLMYIKTFGYSLLLTEYLKNIIHKGWFGVLTIISPSSDVELEIVQIKD